MKTHNNVWDLSEQALPLCLIQQAEKTQAMSRTTLGRVFLASSDLAFQFINDQSLVVTQYYLLQRQPYQEHTVSGYMQRRQAGKSHRPLTRNFHTCPAAPL